MKLLPRTLVGQLLVLLGLALIASLAVSLFLFVDERALAVREADRLGLLDRIAAFFGTTKEGGRIIGPS